MAAKFALIPGRLYIVHGTGSGPKLAAFDDASTPTEPKGAWMRFRSQTGGQMLYNGSYVELIEEVGGDKS